jgi:hypothetical protein
LGNGIVIAVIAGLAVGIALILLFSFNSSAFRDNVTGTTKSGGITISLAGLKDQYATNEPLNFTVTARGHGLICGFDPTAKILNAESGEVVYEVPTLDLIYECLPQAVDVDITESLYDFMHPVEPVVIGETGHYRLEVELEGVLLEKDFFVYKNFLSP